MHRSKIQAHSLSRNAFPKTKPRFQNRSAFPGQYTNQKTIGRYAEYAKQHHRLSTWPNLALPQQRPPVQCADKKSSCVATLHQRSGFSKRLNSTTYLASELIPGKIVAGHVMQYQMNCGNTKLVISKSVSFSIDTDTHFSSRSSSFLDAAPPVDESCPQHNRSHY